MTRPTAKGGVCVLVRVRRDNETDAVHKLEHRPHEATTPPVRLADIDLGDSGRDAYACDHCNTLFVEVTP